jgi:hypothetical protein
VEWTLRILTIMKYPIVNKNTGRIIYLIILIINITGFLKYELGVVNLKSISGFGIPYWIMYLLIFIILFYQVIFNNKLGWYIIASFLFISFIKIIYEHIRNEEFENIIFVVLMYAVIYLLFLMLYPKKLTPKESNKT